MRMPSGEGPPAPSQAKSLFWNNLLVSLCGSRICEASWDTPRAKFFGNNILRDFDKKIAQLGARRKYLVFQQLACKILETNNLREQAESVASARRWAAASTETED